MMNRIQRFSLAQKLLTINLVLVSLLIATALMVWLSMDKIAVETDRINEVNVPQLQRIAELELNVTRTSLQLRHAILSRNDTERDVALDDIAAKKAVLTQALSDFGRGMADAQGKKVFEPLPGLMEEFWRVGTINIALIQAGKRDEAFAYLVDTTIPARNRLLAPLAAEKERQGKRLAMHVGEVKDLSEFDRDLVTLCVLAVTLGLAGMGFYLHSVTQQLGADPQELRHVAEAVAAGDLSMAIRLRNGDSTSAMAALSRMNHNLIQRVRAVMQGAEMVSTASVEIASGNHDLSGRTEQQASALEETSSSMEELGATVRHNAENAASADQMAQSAAHIAAQGGQAVHEVVETMNGINESSRRISDIIGVIDGIAFQTNILALNAAVEAARAGEQGRGFAVVAAEVRSLASRSADAAKEIKALITQSVQQVERGSSLVISAEETIGQLVHAIRQVSTVVSEISVASKEQSMGVIQVGQAVQDMDRVTQQNAALVEQMSAAAASLSQQARELQTSMAYFKLKPAQVSTDHDTPRTPTLGYSA